MHKEDKPQTATRLKPIGLWVGTGDPGGAPLN